MRIKLRCKTNQKAADRIAAFLTNVSDRLLFHIPLYEIGKALGISREDILNIFIQGIYVGISFKPDILPLHGIGHRQNGTFNGGVIKKDLRDNDLIRKCSIFYIDGTIDSQTDIIKRIIQRYRQYRTAVQTYFHFQPFVYRFILNMLYQLLLRFYGGMKRLYGGNKSSHNDATDCFNRYAAVFFNCIGQNLHIFFYQ